MCDVRSPEGVEELAAFARDAMGGVDIWINNAGSNGYSYAPLIDTDPHLLKVRAASARALGIQFRDGRRHERNALHWRTVPAAAVTARGSRLAPWAASPAPSVSFGTPGLTFGWLRCGRACAGDCGHQRVRHAAVHAPGHLAHGGASGRRPRLQHGGTAVPASTPTSLHAASYASQPGEGGVGGCSGAPREWTDRE